MFDIYNNGLLGYLFTHHNENFSGSDYEEKFDSNLKIMGPEWYYADTSKVTYNRNKYGHRSPPLNSLDLDNYILVTGCSHTEGIGLEEDKRYGNLLANYLNANFYNLALGGTGQDAVFYNLLQWNLNVPKSPKLLVYQVPSDGRFLKYNDNPHAKHVYSPLGIWSTNYGAEKFVSYGDLIDLNYWETQKTLILGVITKMFDCPIITLNYNITLKNPLIPKYKNDLEWDFEDMARDCSHPGINSHKKIADQIFEFYKSL